MRVKRGTVARQRRKKVLKRAKGYYGSGSRTFTSAKEKNDRGLAYQYRDRKVRKREFRQLWIQRINAQARICGTTYSKLMSGLKANQVQLDRKVLADMAVRDKDGFAALVKQVVD